MKESVLFLSSLRCTQIRKDGEVDDLGSIFEIENGNEPPSTVSFKSLSAAAIEAVIKNRDKNKEVTVKELSQTFQRAMGTEFEKLERTPFRPQVENHPGKFRSFQEALQGTKKSDFHAFTPQMQHFVFSNWPMLNGAESSIIKFASKTDMRPASEPKIHVELLSRDTKPSESVGTHTLKTQMYV